MALSDAQRSRYARHLLLPELGEAGQLRLVEGRARFAANVDAGARAIAQSYLERAGVREASARAQERAEEPADGAREVEVELGSAADCLRLAGRPELLEAARALTGAFAAVEAIKALGGLGAPAVLAGDLRLSSEEA